MPATRLFVGSTTLLLNTCLAALAQSTPATQPPTAGTRPSPPVLALSSFAAAHDSLLHRVARIRTQTESLQASFTATKGSLGGLHRKVKSYAGTPRGVVNAVGEATRTTVVRQQTLKYRYGVELEKLVYRDGKGHKVLTERYEGHQLTRLELFEYGEPFSAPVASWLLVRGDYLRHTTFPMSPGFKGKPQNSYFFRALPAGQ